MKKNLGNFEMTRASKIFLKENTMGGTPSIGRRNFIIGAMNAGAAVCLAAPAVAKLNFDLLDARSLKLQHTTTGESFSGTYYENGLYLPDAMVEIDYFLRDYKADESIMMDVRLIDLLARMQHGLGSSTVVQITSGYRTQRTNDRLRRVSERAARKSLHIQGMAADFYVPGYRPSKLAKLARQVEAGGIGTYDRARFVHVDVGPARRWHT